eukprot:6206696-Pleurochrysis_carterae.AAC.3
MGEWAARHANRTAGLARTKAVAMTSNFVSSRQKSPRNPRRVSASPDPVATTASSHTSQAMSV